VNNFCSAHNKNLHSHNFSLIFTQQRQYHHILSILYTTSKARAQEEQDILDYRMKLLTFSHQKKVDRLEVLYDDDDDIIAMK